MAANSRIEIKFASSFLLLLVALGGIFGVMYVYQPLESSKVVATTDRKPSGNPGARHESRNYLAARSSQPIHEWPKESPEAKKKRIAEKAAPQGAQEAPTLGQSEIEDMLTDAMRLVDDGNARAAMAILEKVLAAEPRNELALIEMGMIYLIDLKNANGAAGYLEKALQVNPNNKVVLTELIGVYEEIGRTPAGTAFLQGLYDENPENSQLALGLGQILLSQDRVADALPFLERAAEDSNPAAVTEYADALSESGQGEKAVEAYSRVLDIEIQRAQNGYYDNQPGVARERAGLARMDLIGEYVNQGNQAKAREQTEQLRKEFPDEDTLATILEQFQQTRGQVRR